MQDWARNPSDVFRLAEDTLKKTAGTRLADLLLQRIAAVADPETFLDEARNFQNVCLQVVATRPELMDSSVLALYEPWAINALLALLPDDQALFSRVLQRLLPLDDWSLAREMFIRDASATLRGIADTVQQIAAGRAASIGHSWLHGMNERAVEVLSGEFLERLRTTSALAKMAELLGYDRAVVLRAGTAPWARALETSDDDVSGDNRFVFLAFLVSLVLYRPGPGTDTILRRAFEPIHSALSRSSLPARALDIISQYLPDVWWWQQWDTCLRLRVGIVDAVHRAGFDKSVLRNITADNWLLNELEALYQRRGRDRDFID
jgi:hypothetical protein